MQERDGAAGWARKKLRLGDSVAARKRSTPLLDVLPSATVSMSRTRCPLRILAALSLLSLTGCVRYSSGTFDAQGYVNPTIGYRVLGDSAGLLGDAWQLDNFYKKPHDPDGQWIRKDTREYLLDFDVDVDGDGKPDRTLRGFLYDLRWKHREHDAILWLRTFPISLDLRDRELRVLMQAYIGDIAGAGYERMDFQSSSVEVREKRFAAAQLDRGVGAIAGREAVVATVDVVNMDQERLTPGQNRTRVRLALVRMPPTTNPFPDWQNGAYPVLMLAGYANLPEDFESDLSGYNRLLDSIEIEGHKGYKPPRFEAATHSTAPSAVSPPANSAEAPTHAEGANGVAQEQPLSD